MHPTIGERHQWETHGSTTRRDSKEHRLPTSLCQSRRAVGMRVERDEKRSGREKVSGCCISATTTRAVDDDVATDPDPGTTRTLLPAPLRMAVVRMLKRTSERVPAPLTFQYAVGQRRGVV